ncbi:MAG: DUF1990 domain-containing protein [Acidimicrobiales bacterium]|nr:MAG: DUF1990 domain-containing protein [Acidimicrobiales bacterium]
MLWWRGFSQNSVQQHRWRERLQRYHARLVSEQLNYAEPGMTERDDVPRGYRRTLRRERLGNGEPNFRQAWAALSAGHMHRGSGLGLYPDQGALDSGSTFLSYAAWGPLALLNPCRVITVFEEPLRAGITYGTLPGHVLRGEEEFVVELETGGTVWLTTTTVSKPAAIYARLCAPLTRWAQAYVATRFARALQAAVHAEAENHHE